MGMPGCAGNALGGSGTVACRASPSPDPGGTGRGCNSTGLNAKDGAGGTSGKGKRAGAGTVTGPPCRDRFGVVPASCKGGAVSTGGAAVPEPPVVDAGGDAACEGFGRRSGVFSGKVRFGAVGIAMFACAGDDAVSRSGCVTFPCAAGDDTCGLASATRGWSGPVAPRARRPGHWLSAAADDRGSFRVAAPARSGDACGFAPGRAGSTLGSNGHAGEVSAGPAAPCFGAGVTATCNWPGAPVR